LARLVFSPFLAFSPPKWGKNWVRPIEDVHFPPNGGKLRLRIEIPRGGSTSLTSVSSSNLTFYRFAFFFSLILSLTNVDESTFAITSYHVTSYDVL